MNGDDENNDKKRCAVARVSMLEEDTDGEDRNVSFSKDDGDTAEDLNPKSKKAPKKEYPMFASAAAGLNSGTTFSKNLPKKNLPKGGNTKSTRHVYKGTRESAGGSRKKKAKFWPTDEEAEAWRDTHDSEGQLINLPAVAVTLSDGTTVHKQPLIWNLYRRLKTSDHPLHITAGPKPRPATTMLYFKDLLMMVVLYVLEKESVTMQEFDETATPIYEKLVELWEDNLIELPTRTTKLLEAGGRSFDELEVARCRFRPFTKEDVKRQPKVRGMVDNPSITHSSEVEGLNFKSRQTTFGRIASFLSQAVNLLHPSKAMPPIECGARDNDTGRIIVLKKVVGGASGVDRLGCPVVAGPTQAFAMNDHNVVWPKVVLDDGNHGGLYEILLKMGVDMEKYSLIPRHSCNNGMTWPMSCSNRDCLCQGNNIDNLDDQTLDRLLWKRVDEGATPAEKAAIFIDQARSLKINGSLGIQRMLDGWTGKPKKIH